MAFSPVNGIAGKHSGLLQGEQGLGMAGGRAVSSLKDNGNDQRRTEYIFTNGYAVKGSHFESETRNNKTP